jgi:putative thiamine transport system ATP-binding protein
METGVSLVLENISAYIGHVRIFEKLSLTILPGEIVSVMGASGSGKTTLLSAVAGDLPEPIYAVGKVNLNGRDLNAVRPEQRRIGRLFQDDLLFPHLTVGENLLFGVERGPKEQRIAMMKTGLQRIDLEGFEDRAPHTLSGGQRSRVALMRALLAKPDAMLLDEPFNKLDRELRTTIRDYTYAHLQERKIPTLLVTHDFEDVPKGGRVVNV